MPVLVSVFTPKAPSRMVSEEAPLVSPMTIMPLLLIAFVPLPKSNVVAPVVAIRPELPLVSVSLPVENVLVPPVCHDRELVLLKVELAVPERSTAPMSVPALLIVRFPERTVEVTLPTVTDVVGALIAKAETLPEFVVIVPLLVSVILPAETLPFGVEINRTVAALAEAPTAFSVALEPTVTLTVPVPPSARMALPLPLPETLPTVIEPFATTVMLPVPTVVDTLPPPLMTDAVMPCEPAPEMLPEALALFAVIVLLLVMLMLPAPAQGALAVATRKDDEKTAVRFSILGDGKVANINHVPKSLVNKAFKRE